jgi:hypothetical protein
MRALAMKLPRTRFKLWMLMMAVAMAAVAMGIVRIGNLRSAYQQRAAEYALEEQDELKILGTLERRISRLGGHEDETSKASLQAHVETRANRRAWADYYGQLKRKHQMAASRPWVPVAADSPPIVP